MEEKRMAYYDDAPKKRVRTNYAEKGTWEEEGSRYSNRGRKTNFRSGQAFRKEEDQSKTGAESVRRRSNGPHPGDSHGEKYRDRPHGEKYRDRSEKQGERPVKTGYEDYEFHGSSETVETDDQGSILCGRNPIREALRSGRGIEKLLVQKGELSGSAREIVKEARERRIMVQEADKRRMDAIAPHHQGLIAFAEVFKYATVDEILASAGARREAPFIVLLDGVTDPHNLGAIIRTAECTGAHGVIIPQHRSVGLTPSAVKASAGAVEHIPVARVTNLNRTIEDLKQAGLWVYALSMDGKDYEKVDFQGGTALVIGAEGEGISRLTAEKCDMAVSLPMLGKLDSLNASVAAGVVMYRVLSSRRSRK